MALRSAAPRLRDIIDTIDRIRSEPESVTLDAFEAEWRKRWLVARGIEIISEASRHLPADMKDRHPEIPWRKVAGIGNVLRHEYERTAPEILWSLAHQDLATLEKVCREEPAAADPAEG
jgi:uncharacterized protein with HEPN domain